MGRKSARYSWVRVRCGCGFIFGSVTICFNATMTCSQRPLMNQKTVPPAARAVLHHRGRVPFPVHRELHGNHAGMAALASGARRRQWLVRDGRWPWRAVACHTSLGRLWVDRVVSGRAAGECSDAAECAGCACIGLVADAALCAPAVADPADRVDLARDPFARRLKPSRASMTADQSHNIAACPLTESGTAHPAAPWRRHRDRRGSRPCPAPDRTRSWP